MPRNAGRKRHAMVATGRPRRSASGHSQSMVPSACQVAVRAAPAGSAAPSCPAARARLDRARAFLRPVERHLPEHGEAVRQRRAASTASSFERGSQLTGGWTTAASTPAASISASSSSAVKAGTWRWWPLGVPPDQMCTCASTIFTAAVSRPADRTWMVRLAIMSLVFAV